MDELESLTALRIMQDAQLFVSDRLSPRQAVQERKARLPYMEERWISERRYDRAQKCWMYRLRKDHTDEDQATTDPG